MTELQQRLLTIIDRFPERRIVIVGDAIADRFLHGSISRVSREAPVFILRHEQTETIPGGAANCAVNLASLGAHVSLVSVVGDDEPGSELKNKLKSAGVDISSVLTAKNLQTTTKVRILAGHAHSSRQQVIRIDYEGTAISDHELRSGIVAELKRKLSDADALIVSDYNYGVVDDSMTKLLKEVAQEPSFPVLVDSRFRLESFPGLTAATPNEDEVEHLIGEALDSQAKLEATTAELKSRLDFKALLVTRGPNGMMLLADGSAPLHIRAVGGDQPVDVTGAGDTVIATFTLGLASGASFSDAAHLANYAGGLVVMKRGTASVTAQELEQSILNSEVL